MPDREYREVNFRECASRILTDHYSHKLPKNVKVSFADLQYVPQRVVLSCCTFSGPVGRFEVEGILELTRLVRTSEYDRPLTKLISKALGCLRTKPSVHLLISLADAEEDHHGGIYQACSWIYGGMRDERLDGFNFDGQFVPARTCNHRFGTSSVETITREHGAVPHFDAGKHLYWKPLTKHGMQMAVNMELRSLPYPKPMLLAGANVDLKAGHHRKGVVELPTFANGPTPTKLAAVSLMRAKENPGS